MFQLPSTLPTLFSRNSGGSVQQWTIHYLADQHWTVCGQVNGALVTNKPTTCKGKNIGRANETSPEAQAKSEAQSKWDKKVKEGYHQDVTNIDTHVFLQPMLAKKFEDRLKKVTYPVGVQLKLNGGRCVATKDGLFTRTGERYLAVPHIEKALAPFFVLNPDAVVDGELFAEGNKQKLNETMKLIRRTVNLTQEDFDKSEAQVRYYIYDCYNTVGTRQDAVYQQRALEVSWICQNYPFCTKVDTMLASDEAAVYTYFRAFVENGEEGAIVRLLDRGYENKRSDALLKVKPEDDSEAIIMDISPGKGNWSDAGKVITLKWKDAQGVERIFDASFKGTYPQAVEFLDNKHLWIGKEVTFLYMGLTGLGVPNYARVDIDNCLKK